MKILIDGSICCFTTTPKVGYCNNHDIFSWDEFIIYFLVTCCNGPYNEKKGKQWNNHSLCNSVMSRLFVVGLNLAWEPIHVQVYSNTIHHHKIRTMILRIEHTEKPGGFSVNEKLEWMDDLILVGQGWTKQIDDHYVQEQLEYTKQALQELILWSMFDMTSDLLSSVASNC